MLFAGHLLSGSSQSLMTFVTWCWPALAQTFAMTALIRYDAARKAIAAAHRVDEAKKIRDKAEAVRTYAKLAGDVEMQNMACEIRLRAERRAGQLLLEMEKNPGTRGEGRPRKDGTKRRSASFIALPPKLDEIGITKDQSSKWQRLSGADGKGTTASTSELSGLFIYALTNRRPTAEVRGAERALGASVSSSPSFCISHPPPSARKRARF